MPTSRVAQAVRLLVETAATVNAQEIRMQPVQGISGAGRYIIDGTTVSAVGTARLALGQIVPVVYESGRPLVIFALEWQRGQGESGESATGGVEQIRVATVWHAPSSTYVQDIQFRNDVQTRSLNLSSTYTGWSVNDLRWSPDDRYFGAWLSKAGASAFMIYQLDRRPGELYGVRTPVARRVKTIPIRRLELLRYTVNGSKAGPKSYPVLQFTGCAGSNFTFGARIESKARSVVGSTTWYHSTADGGAGAATEFMQTHYDWRLTADLRVLAFYAYGVHYQTDGAVTDWTLNVPGGTFVWTPTAPAQQSIGIGGGCSFCAILDVEAQQFVFRGGPGNLNVSLTGTFDLPLFSTPVAEVTQNVDFDAGPTTSRRFAPQAFAPTIFGAPSPPHPIEATADLPWAVGMTGLTATPAPYTTEAFMGSPTVAVHSSTGSAGDSSVWVSGPNSAFVAEAPTCGEFDATRSPWGIRMTGTLTTHTIAEFTHAYTLAPLALDHATHPADMRVAAFAHSAGGSPLARTFGVFVLDGSGKLLHTVRALGTAGFDARIIAGNRRHVLWRYRTESALYDPPSHVYLTDVETGNEILVAEDIAGASYVYMADLVPALAFLAPDVAYALEPFLYFAQAWNSDGRPTLHWDASAVLPGMIQLTPPKHGRLAPFGTLKADASWTAAGTETHVVNPDALVGYR